MDLSLGGHIVHRKGKRDYQRKSSNGTHPFYSKELCLMKICLDHTWPHDLFKMLCIDKAWISIWDIIFIYIYISQNVWSYSGYLAVGPHWWWWGQRFLFHYGSWRPSTVNYEAMKFRQSCGLFPSTTLSCYGISNAENLFMERVVELSGKSMNE